MGAQCVKQLEAELLCCQMWGHRCCSVASCPSGSPRPSRSPQSLTEPQGQRSETPAEQEKAKLRQRPEERSHGAAHRSPWAEAPPSPQPEDSILRKITGSLSECPDGTGGSKGWSSSEVSLESMGREDRYCTLPQSAALPLDLWGSFFFSPSSVVLSPACTSECRSFVWPVFELVGHEFTILLF